MQENQNLENGSLGGDEAKLREELAAMTKKATDLEVMVMIMMIMGMVIMIYHHVVVMVMMIIIMTIITL